MIDKDDLVIIGKITKSHGVKGDLKIKPLTTHPKEYLDIKSVFLCKKEEQQEFKVSKIKTIKDFWVFEIEGISSVEEAEYWRDGDISIKESELFPLDENEFFIHEIINSEVYSLEGEFLGKVISYFETGANGVCEVKKIDGSEFLFPTIEDVLVEFNSEEAKVIINVLPDMLD